MTKTAQIVADLQSTIANNNSNINVVSIMQALKDVKSTTFATLTQASEIGLAAAHKATQSLFKVTVQNVVLNNSPASLYNNAVNKEVNDLEEAFQGLASHYEQINDSYSVCALKSDTNKHYLRAIVNTAKVIYFDANTQQEITKEHVAQFLAPAAAKKLLAPSKVNVIKHADISHTVTVRNFALKNIHSINLTKNQLTCKG